MLFPPPLARGHRLVTIPSLLLWLLTIIWLLVRFFEGSVGYLEGLLVLGGLTLVVFVVQFFRDPPREVGDIPPTDVVSPADGVMFEVDDKTQPGTTVFRIRMRFWDVHVNRMPTDGVLLGKEKKRGLILPILPGLNQYSKNLNARQTLTFEASQGFEFKMVQISGTLAYRTVAYGKSGTQYNRGDRVGMIRFGSETDLHLPTEIIHWMAPVGQKVRGGTTVIARLKTPPATT